MIYLSKGTPVNSSPLCVAVNNTANTLDKRSKELWDEGYYRLNEVTDKEDIKLIKELETKCLCISSDYEGNDASYDIFCKCIPLINTEPENLSGTDKTVYKWLKYKELHLIVPEIVFLVTTGTKPGIRFNGERGKQRLIRMIYAHIPVEDNALEKIMRDASYTTVESIKRLLEQHIIKML